MAEKRKKSKYQIKMRARKALASKIGGCLHSPNKDGKRIPYAMPVLLELKRQKDAGLLACSEEIEESHPELMVTPDEELIIKPKYEEEID